MKFTRPKDLSSIDQRIARERMAVAEQLEDVLITTAEFIQNEEQLDAFLAPLPDQVQRERIIERLRPLLRFKLEPAKIIQ